MLAMGSLSNIEMRQWEETLISRDGLSVKPTTSNSRWSIVVFTKREILEEQSGYLKRGLVVAGSRKFKLTISHFFLCSQYLDTLHLPKFEGLDKQYAVLKTMEQYLDSSIHSLKSTSKSYRRQSMVRSRL